MNVIKPYYFEHPQYGKMRVLTAGGKTFFCMSDLQRVFDKTPEDLYQIVADSEGEVRNFHIVMEPKKEMFVHCYCASGVFLLSDNSEVTPIDVRFNGRILTSNDQIFD